MDMWLGKQNMIFSTVNKKVCPTQVWRRLCNKVVE